MKSQVLTNAWNIARNAAATFGGAAISYIAEAMKTAWKVAKLVKEGGKVWIKDSFFRVYLNAYPLFSSALKHNFHGRCQNPQDLKFFFDARTGEFGQKGLSNREFNHCQDRAKCMITGRPVHPSCL